MAQPAIMLEGLDALAPGGISDAVTQSVENFYSARGVTAGNNAALKTQFDTIKRHGPVRRGPAATACRATCRRSRAGNGPVDAESFLTFALDISNHYGVRTFVIGAMISGGDWRSGLASRRNPLQLRLWEDAPLKRLGVQEIFGTDTAIACSGVHQARNCTMSRFFFNVYHTTAELDDVGIELSDEQVLAEATKTAGQIIQDLDGGLRLGREWRMEVTDESGSSLFVVRLLTERTK